MASPMALKPGHRCRINDVQGTVLLDPVTNEPCAVTLALVALYHEEQLNELPLPQARNLRDVLNWLLEKEA